VGNASGVYVNMGLLEPLRAALTGSVVIALGISTFSKEIVLWKAVLVCPFAGLSVCSVVLYGRRSS